MHYFMLLQHTFLNCLLYLLTNIFVIYTDIVNPTVGPTRPTITIGEYSLLKIILQCLLHRHLNLI